MTKKLVLLFDIDGTLVRCGGAGGQSLCAALSEEFSVGQAQPVALHGRTDLGIASELLQKHGLEASPQNIQRLFQRYFRLLPAQLKRKQEESQAEILPGVVRLLDSIKRLKFLVCGLMTGNTPTSAQIKLQHFSLWDYFELGVFGDTVAHRPDLSEPALKTVTRYCGYPVSGESIVVIGDTPLDAELAIAMRAKCLCVTTGGFEAAALWEAGADWVVEDLSNTQSVLDWMEAQFF